MNRKKRKNYSAQEKVKIIRLHLLEGVPVSDVCDRYNLQPTVYYRWQKQFFENGESAFQSIAGTIKKRQEMEIENLKDKIQTKNEILAELMEEHIKLKKNLGES